jgi:hypothetical protein
MEAWKASSGHGGVLSEGSGRLVPRIARCDARWWADSLDVGGDQESREQEERAKVIAHVPYQDVCQQLCVTLLDLQVGRGERMLPTSERAATV